MLKVGFSLYIRRKVSKVRKKIDALIQFRDDHMDHTHRWNIEDQD